MALRPISAAVASRLTIYSPAPPTGPLHALNLTLAAVAGGWHGLPPVETVAVALPDSINGIVDRIRDRGRHLPIVTTVDFRLARQGRGPAWHSYPSANGDLKFVAKLYDVGFGIQVRDPMRAAPDMLRGCRIAAPPRPSAVRLLTETLLRDGWGILDQVEIVDATPSTALAAMENGDVDATSWNLVLPTPDGFRPTLPVDGRFLAVDGAIVDRINAANIFPLALIHCLAGGPPLLSFAQALAAWDETDGDIVSGLLSCLAASCGANRPGLPAAVAGMVDWPDLRGEEIHLAARRFYAEQSLPVAG